MKARDAFKVVFLCLTLAVGSASGQSNDVDTNGQRQIILAIRQFVTLGIATQHTNVITFRDGQRQTNVTSDNKALLNAIEAVDTSKCPLVFQEAWLKYVHAWERSVAANKQEGAQLLFDVGGLTAGGLTAPKLAMDLAKDAEKTTEIDDRFLAWQLVEEAALHYGIPLHPKPTNLPGKTAGQSGRARQ